MNSKAVLKGCLVYTGALLAILALVTGAAVLTLGRFLTTTDSLSPADAIVILSGDSEDFVRAEHATGLFHQGYAPTVVFSSASSRYTDLPCSPLQQSLAVARSQGLPADMLITTSGAESTYDEAGKLRRLAQQHKWHSLIVVTDLFHTRRAGRTFRALLPDTTIYVSPAPDPDQDTGRWWQTEDDLVTAITEVLKLGFYWINYGIAPVE